MRWAGRAVGCWKAARQTLVRASSALLLLGLAGCDPAAEALTTHPAAALPEACHSIIHWSQRPDEAALGLLRSLRQKGGDDVAMPEIFFQNPGVLAIYSDPQKGWSSRLAFVDLEKQTEPDLDAMQAGLTEGFVLVLEGRRLWMLPKALEGFPGSRAPKLAQQGWFAKSVEGLGVGQGQSSNASLDLHMDLSRLLDMARQKADKDERRTLSLLVGIESFLSLGMRVLPAAAKGEGKIDLYFRLSLTPDGIAAALDVDSSGQLLARLIHDLPEEAGYMIMNFRLATLTDALKARLLAGEGTNAVGLATSMSKTAKVLLRGDLPRAFGNQWALVDPQGKLGMGGSFKEAGAYLLATLDYSKKLGDQMLPLAQAGSFFGADVMGKRIPGGLYFEASLMGMDLAIVLGENFGALASRSSKQTLLDLLAREAEASLPVLPMPEGLPRLPEKARMLGYGSWSLEFLRTFLPGTKSPSDPIRGFLEALIAKDRRFLFQSLRVENGFLLQGRW